MSSKRCFKCLDVKPLESFYKHSQMRDGRLNKCIDCQKKDSRAYRLKNIDHYRQYDRDRASLPHRRQMAALIINRWKNQHPKRRAANVAVGNAVRDGRLTPEPCFICGGKSEAHHPDYDQPLSVVWLCPAHHKQAHALSKKAA